MSAISNADAKPPRPCTEYNIFFQLERAYILQVLLHAPPSLEPDDVFRPAQSTYAGLPPLPRRYASLVLPSDWHLPGKEKRRKRKHRKSHGAIGFHELSERIVEAWKRDNEEVRGYCSEVRAAGMARYKAETKEWKRKQGADARKRAKKAASRPKPSAREPEETKGDAASKDAFEALLENVCARMMVQHGAPIIPFVIPSEDVDINMEEMNRAFDVDLSQGVALADVGDDEIRGMWHAQDEPSTLEPGPAAITEAIPSTDQGFKTISQGDDRALRNLSIVSNETVDVDDRSILDMCNRGDVGNAIDSYRQLCLDRAQTSGAAGGDARRSTDHAAVFGSDGYTKSMQDIKRMNTALGMQIAQLQRSEKQGFVRRRSVAACSA